MTKQYMKSGNQDVVNKMYHLNFFLNTIPQPKHNFL